MVQYVITPWRHRAELLNVRRAFYPPPNTSRAYNDQERHEAVELVSIWVQRGNCPHSVESTALLVSAMLNDSGGSSTYAVRAAYATAFSRFVTGLLDGCQDKKHKLSMYSLAKNIGLPATFVELRHQCIHEELPSLAKLRAAGDRSLLWIWDHYWKRLEKPANSVHFDELRPALLLYLQQQTDSQPQIIDQQKDNLQQLRQWNEDDLLEVLMEIIEASTTEPGILRRALRLSRAILSEEEITTSFETSGNVPPALEREIISLKDIEADAAKAAELLQEEDTVEGELNSSVGDEEVLEEEEEEEEEEEDGGEGGTGWEMWKGPWAPKPIGVV